MQPNTTDWFGRWRPVQNAANDYLIDREAQRNDVIYTGITHIAMQDQAITESMGAIVDHSFEHLAPSDQMITRTRRRLLMAARALREEGAVPPCVDQPDIFRQVRSGEAVLAADDWQAAYRDRFHMRCGRRGGARRRSRSDARFAPTARRRSINRRASVGSLPR